MKKLLLPFILFFLIIKIPAQVVFCPPGAQWNALFSGSIFSPGTTQNAFIAYTGDSIAGIDTIKILIHNTFYMTCDRLVTKTFIKQKGDTVFFYNKVTQGTWQILYNFAAQPGQSWQTTILALGPPKTLSFTVQAVGTVTINGYALKQLTIVGGQWGAGTQITERIGANTFLFNFSTILPQSCDWGVFIEPLCYKDNSFGLYQVSSKDCNYYTRNSVGIESVFADEKQVKVFPNPTSGLLNIKFENQTREYQIVLSNVLGERIVNVGETTGTETKLDLSPLRHGIYFLSVFEKGRLVAREKIVKE